MTISASPLPVVRTAASNWQTHAACREIDSAVFFHPENERGRAATIRNDRAKSICHRCPVIRACRQHALTVREAFGVWGGLTVDERNALLRHPGAQVRARRCR